MNWGNKFSTLLFSWRTLSESIRHPVYSSRVRGCLTTVPAKELLRTLHIKQLVIVFAIAVVLMPSAQAQTYQVIYSFTGGADGSQPEAGLTVDEAGNLYGTTVNGGEVVYGPCPFGCGTVFEVAGSGSSWSYSTIYTFHSVLDGDGANPYAKVTIGPNGSLYGTTRWGGGGGSYCDFIDGTGCGTVFSLSGPTETLVHTFSLDEGGWQPASEPIFDQTGNIYGTASDSEGGFGTVYKLTSSGGSWTESVLYTYHGGSDGQYPSGLVFDGSGNLYGTTEGSLCEPPPYYACGTVFELTHSGSGWVKSNLYTFQGGSDGYHPAAELIVDSSGNLYGTTSSGGLGGGGTVFMLTPSQGSWTFSTIYSFTGTEYGGPGGNLLMDAAGNLYGTTIRDGAYGNGAVFKLTPSVGGWTYTSLHDFTGGNDGGYPVSSVVLDASGNLFGTASGGGNLACNTPYGCGVVFEIGTPVQYLLSVSVTGTGNVTSLDNFINCPGTCSHPYPANTQVTLNATPAVGWTFTGWSGACSGLGECSVTMTQSLSVGATFVREPSYYTLTVSTSGNGIVRSVDRFINCPGTCTHLYLSHTRVTLNATPAQGWAFAGWSGACSGTGSCNITMTSNLSATATFNEPGFGFQFIPVPPCRLVDTRQTGGPIQGGTYRAFNLPQLAQSNPQCESLSSAAAFSLNVSVVPSGRPLGYLTIWPTGEAQPSTATMNSLDGRVKR